MSPEVKKWFCELPKWRAMGIVILLLFPPFMIMSLTLAAYESWIKFNYECDQQEKDSSNAR